MLGEVTGSLLCLVLQGADEIAMAVRQGTLSLSVPTSGARNSDIEELADNANAVDYDIMTDDK